MTTNPFGEEVTDARIREDGSTQVALDATKMAALLTALHNGSATKSMYVKARGSDGTGTVGLYLELVCTTAGRESHTRYFVVGEHVYLSHRLKGMTKANWRAKKAPSLAGALQVIDAELARPNVQLFGQVLLVELEADSVSQIESGQLPSARFKGVYRIEKTFGKYEFGEIHAADSMEIPLEAIRLLSPSIVTAPFVPAADLDDDDDEAFVEEDEEEF